jgi:hypothetical protein
MCNPEQRHHPTELSIAQSEIVRPRSWAEYICQLGNQFQVRITQPGDTLRLGLPDTQRQLVIATCSTFVVVAHGETTEDGVMPDEEIVFDISEEGTLVPSEILYTSAVWENFQAALRASNLPPSDEQSFDGERFAAHILDKVAQEAWVDTSI